MATKVDINKVSKAVSAFAALNEVEAAAFAAALGAITASGVVLQPAPVTPQVTDAVTSAAPAPTPTPTTTPRRHGPDPHGRYKCSYCGKILPTKRGRSIHEKMHDRETAPPKAPATATAAAAAAEKKS